MKEERKNRGVVVVDAVGNDTAVAAVAVAAEHDQDTDDAVVMETTLIVRRTVGTVHHKDSPSRHPPRRPSSNTPGSADHTVDADIAVVVVVADGTSSRSSSLALVSYSFRVCWPRFLDVVKVARFPLVRDGSRMTSAECTFQGAFSWVGVVTAGGLTLLA